jgi:hypothetical protein
MWSSPPAQIRTESDVCGLGWTPRAEFEDRAGHRTGFPSPTGKSNGRGPLTPELSVRPCRVVCQDTIGLPPPTAENTLRHSEVKTILAERSCEPGPDGIASTARSSLDWRLRLPAGVPFNSSTTTAAARPEPGPRPAGNVAKGADVLDYDAKVRCAASSIPGTLRLVSE